MEIRNLLVVENDSSALKAVARLLRLKGYAVSTALSFESALDLQLEFEFGIFDIDLGDGDGVKLACRLCTEGRVRRAVFLTGCTDPQKLDRARSIGEVVVKGSSSQELLNALRGSDQRPPCAMRVQKQAARVQ